MSAGTDLDQGMVTRIEGHNWCTRAIGNYHGEYEHECIHRMRVAKFFCWSNFNHNQIILVKS
jgi:hypothetical protein